MDEPYPECTNAGSESKLNGYNPGIWKGQTQSRQGKVNAEDKQGGNTKPSTRPLLATTRTGGMILKILVHSTKSSTLRAWTKNKDRTVRWSLYITDGRSP